MKYTTDKNTAINQYKQAKENYLNNRTQQNWITFCDIKKTCMLLGIRI